MLEKRAEGYDVHAAGDLNFIRSTSLDAAGGNPTVYKEQADWIKNLGWQGAMRRTSPYL
jgi:hypothetical protein